jgi:hypothetical protein
MKKTIRLTESDLIRLVKRVIQEQNITQGTDSIGGKYNISSPFKVNQTFKGQRDVDNQIYTLTVTKVGQGWITARIDGPGSYEGRPLKGLEPELSTNIPGEVSGNMKMGTFKIIKK